MIFRPSKLASSRRRHVISIWQPFLSHFSISHVYDNFAWSWARVEPSASNGPIPFYLSALTRLFQRTCLSGAMSAPLTYAAHTFAFQQIISLTFAFSLRR